MFCGGSLSILGDYMAVFIFFGLHCSRKRDLCGDATLEPVFLHPVQISKGCLAAGYLNSHGEVRRRSFVPGSCWVVGLQSISSNRDIRWRMEIAAGGQRLASLLLDQQKGALIGE
jgi:hypothetical protein